MNRRNVGLIFIALIAIGAGRAPAQRPLPADLPFKMSLPTAPTFPRRDFNVLDYGAVADGRTLNTAALAKTLAACAVAGGGRVVVPAGRWLTGAIHLKSNVNLHLEAGATLLFSTDPQDYLPAVWVRWAGTECMNYSPLIYARDCDNIALTGAGTLDGQGPRWWHWARRQTENATRLYRMAVDNLPVEQRVFAKPEDAMRPDFVQWMNCRNVLIEGVTVVSGPFWTLHPTYCDGVTIRGVTIHTVGPNNDGIDIDSSRNVLVEHCDFLTGDDAIVLKSGLNEEGRRINRPTENVVIRRCTIRKGHGGVALGSEMSGGLRHVLIYDCDFIGTDTGVRLKSARGRGAAIEGVWCRDLRMTNLGAPAINLTTSYRAWFGSDTGVAPALRNIHFEGITINGAVAPIAIDGLPEQPIENITFRDLRAVTRRDVRIADARGIVFENVALTTYEAPSLFTLTNARDVTIKNLTYADGPETLVVAGGATAGVRLLHSDASRVRTPFRLEAGTAANAVEVEPARK